MSDARGQGGTAGGDAWELVRTLVERARAAQSQYERYDQRAVDEVVLATGWAIMEPTRNRELAELAVRDTGIGDVEDKVRKNYRKTLGLLRDLQGARTVGVIAEMPDKGLTEFARPVGVVGAITPSTNPAATPANKIINALKCRNAVIVAPSPKGQKTALRLTSMIHDRLVAIGMPRALAEGLVQVLPAPVDKARTHALMAQVDLVVATGSQANVRAAYTSGTPAFGVGAGNVAAIVDETADTSAAAARIALSKTFDHATSCSSENAVVIVDAVYDRMRAALAASGGVMLDAPDKQRLMQLMWPNGKLSGDVIAQPAQRIAERAGLACRDDAALRFLMVEETGWGTAHPYSGEKLSPVLAVYRAQDLEDAIRIVRGVYGYQGAGHSVSLHTREEARATVLAESLPVARVIVNQAHCIATGGSFDNGLPFSLSMGCGTWGRNNFSENLTYRHYLNITRVARPIPERVPTDDEIFGAYFERHGRH
jgi:sulfoacetaldehyde dehydrogenase